MDMPLLPPIRTRVDIEQLRKASEGLKRTVDEIPHAELYTSVLSVLSIVEKMTIDLQSYTLNELPSHTDSIQTKIESVLALTQKVAEECTEQDNSETIGSSILKVLSLSHNLWFVSKIRRKHCSKDQHDEAAALDDLVKTGADLLGTVDSLLRSVQKFGSQHDTDATSVCCLKKYQGSLKWIDIHHPLLKKEIEGEEIALLAIHFDNVENYMQSLGLSPPEQTDVRNQLHHGTRPAMIKCLSLWRQRDPARATYRALVKMLQEIRKGDIAIKIWNECIYQREM